MAQVAEDGLARVGRNHLRRNAQSRQKNDVYLGVAQEPEQVLEQNRASTLVRQHFARHHDVAQVKRSPHRTVKHQKQRRAEQNRERQHTKNGGHQEGPDRQRKAGHRHALGAQVDHRHDVVE